MKKLILTGNVGANYDTRVGPTGKEFYTFSVAHYEGKNKDGTNKKPLWIDVIFPREHYAAKYVENNIRKGSKVIVRGKNRIQAYINKEGKASYSESLWLEEIEVIHNDSTFDKTNEVTKIDDNKPDELSQETEVDFDY